MEGPRYEQLTFLPAVARCVLQQSGLFIQFCFGHLAPTVVEALVAVLAGKSVSATRSLHPVHANGIQYQAEDCHCKCIMPADGDLPATTLPDQMEGFMS